MRTREEGAAKALSQVGLVKVAVPLRAGGALLRNGLARLRTRLTPRRDWIPPREYPHGGGIKENPAAVYADPYLEELRTGTAAPETVSFARQQARARGLTLNEYLNRAAELPGQEETRALAGKKPVEQYLKEKSRLDNKSYATDIGPDPRFNNLRFTPRGK